MTVVLFLLKVLFLFLAVRYTFVNIGKMYYKQQVSSANTFYMALGIVGFIAVQFEFWKM